MQLLFNILVALASILVISLSARYIIMAISSYAKKTGISDYLVGFLVVSIGTALPELSTAVVGSFSNQSKLILGDLIGGSILDVTVILGITAIIGKKIIIQGTGLKKTFFTVLIMVTIPLLLGLDGKFSTFDGIILIASFIAYIIRLLSVEKKFGHIKKEIAFKEIWKDMFIFLGCIVALLLSTRWLLISSLQIASELNIPFFTMGLFLIAIGTTIPELTISIKSILAGVSSIAFGDLLGAVVANTTFVLGIAAILNPFSFDRGSFISATLFLITSVFIGMLFLNKKEITWKEGVGLLMIYITFFVTQGIASFL